MTLNQHEARNGCPFIIAVQHEVLLLVVLFLNGAHLHPEDLLHLGRQRFLHVLLDSTQQKRLQFFMKACVARVSAFPVILFEHLP